MAYIHLAKEKKYYNKQTDNQCMIVRSQCMIVRSQCMIIRSQCMIFRSQCMIVRSPFSEESN